MVQQVSSSSDVETGLSTRNSSNVNSNSNSNSEQTQQKQNEALDQEEKPLLDQEQDDEKPSSEEAPRQHRWIAYGAFSLLVTQMTGLAFLMRHSRTTGSNTMYAASTAVLNTEVAKFTICCIIVWFQSHGQLLQQLKLHILESPKEVLKLCVPSVLYTIQNNLLYMILSNLDAATYQVCNQLKILTTAMFSALLLQRKFSVLQWMALFVLTAGVALVEFPDVKGKQPASSTSTDDQNRFIGFMGVLASAATSGFAGVYFEKMLKQKSGSATNNAPSLWMRNIQMYLSSIFVAAIAVALKDGPKVTEQGYLGGYNGVVWSVVAVQACGGLLVSVVVKYANNIVKVFATSFSIIISCILSAVFFDFQPSATFNMGALMVVVATFIYSTNPYKQK